jgi:hypothetical protein
MLDSDRLMGISCRLVISNRSPTYILMRIKQLSHDAVDRPHSEGMRFLMKAPLSPVAACVYAAVDSWSSSRLATVRVDSPAPSGPEVKTHLVGNTEYIHLRFVGVQSTWKHRYRKLGESVRTRLPFVHAMTYHREDERSQRQLDPPS